MHLGVIGRGHEGPAGVESLALIPDLDPEDYLRDLFRVLPFWPKDRYLELAPKSWLATRARLDPTQVEHEVGWLTIPPLG